jgi:Ni/Co efflux regulator RcnB
MGGPGRFRRGQVLPQAERGYVIGDYYRYHLRRPPPGYYWYRNGEDFVLAAVASGLIFEVVAGDGY